jgi:uncharacterized protein
MAAPVVIDSLEFARTGEDLRGEVEVAALERLADALFDSGGQLVYRIHGNRDSHQRPRLELSVDGAVNLKCQRCLGSFVYPVALQSSLLVLTASGGASNTDIDDLDGVPADPHTNVHALVEDEVLLAIPYAPRHPEGQCTTEVKVKDDRPTSPFAVLANLKSR